MLMKREMLLAATSVALLAGCSQEIPVRGFEGQPTFAIEGEITVNGLPETLPPEVAAHRDRVVNIVGYGYNEATGKSEQTVNGSGFQFDTRHILTAGHVGVTKSGLLKADCDNMLINASTEEPRSHYGADNTLLGTTAKVASAKGKDDTRGSDYDAAWLTLEVDQPTSLDPQKPVTVRSTPLQKGEPIFIMGLGHDDSKNRDTVRNPNQLALEHNDLPIGRNTPRVIGAIVAGPLIEGEPIVTALTGLKDYSELPDPEATNRKGDSGGPAFDANGEYMGIVSLSLGWTGPSKDQKPVAENRAGVTINGAPDGYQYSMTGLHRITPESLAELQAMPDVACTPAPAGQ